MRRPFEFMRPLARLIRFREDDVPEECVPSVRGPECAVRHEGLVSLCRGFDIALRTPLSLYSMGPSSSLVFRGKVYFFPTPWRAEEKGGKKSPVARRPQSLPGRKRREKGLLPESPPKMDAAQPCKTLFPLPSDMSH